MKKIIKLLLKILAGIVVFVVILLTAATITLSTESVQEKLANYAVEQLEPP